MKIAIAIFVVILLGTGAFFIHVPDNSSDEFHAWKGQRALDHEHQVEMEKVFLSESFTFNDLELIEVAPGPVYYSRWGHVLLRFKGSGVTPEDDLAVSFLADFNDHPVNKFKASFGGYEVLPKLDTLRNYSADYMDREKRFMNGYLLKTNEEQRKKLLEILRAWTLDKKLPQTYSFFWNNCVGVMTKLFVESKIITVEQAKKAYFPKDIPGFLLASELISDEEYKKYAEK